MQTVVVIANWEIFLPCGGHQPTDLASLGQALRRMRERRGMSADELAAAAGTSRQRIDAIERGGLDPTYALLLALAEGLGTQPSALVKLAERLARSDER